MVDVFAASAAVAGPTYVSWLGAHAEHARAVLHVDPRMDCAIVGDRMVHRHLLGGFGLGHWRHGNVAERPGCILLDHDGIPH